MVRNSPVLYVVPSHFMQENVRLFTAGLLDVLLGILQYYSILTPAYHFDTIFSDKRDVLKYKQKI